MSSEKCWPFCWSHNVLVIIHKISSRVTNSHMQKLQRYFSYWSELLYTYKKYWENSEQLLTNPTILSMQTIVWVTEKKKLATFMLCFSGVTCMHNIQINLPLLWKQGYKTFMWSPLYTLSLSLYTYINTNYMTHQIHGLTQNSGNLQFCTNQATENIFVLKKKKNCASHSNDMRLLI